MSSLLPTEKKKDRQFFTLQESNSTPKKYPAYLKVKTQQIKDFKQNQNTTQYITCALVSLYWLPTAYAYIDGVLPLTVCENMSVHLIERNLHLLPSALLPLEQTF